MCELSFVERNWLSNVLTVFFSLTLSRLIGFSSPIPTADLSSSAFASVFPPIGCCSAAVLSSSMECTSEGTAASCFSIDTSLKAVDCGCSLGCITIKSSVAMVPLSIASVVLPASINDLEAAPFACVMISCSFGSHSSIASASVCFSTTIASSIDSTDITSSVNSFCTFSMRCLNAI
uniref:Putative secreted peptide n=1 Tax=Anopheles braziliensis TaxID=58242 RepID=A0A2M3ZRM8_9DIPT